MTTIARRHRHAPWTAPRPRSVRAQKPKPEHSELRAVLGTVVPLFAVLGFLIAALITLDFVAAWLVTGRAY
jgi:hypothetical protein